MILIPSKPRLSGIKFYFLILAVSLCVNSSYAFLPQDGRYADEIKIIEDYVKKEIERTRIPSLRLAFYKDDFVWKKGFGYADLEHKIPAEPHTRYRLASISKPITAVGILRLMQDGKLDLEDMKCLVGLLSDAREVCPAFDELFFPALKEVVLEDGQIGLDEQFYLLKMLYSDGKIRPSETQFLLELRESVQDITPEFEALCETALTAHPTNWET